jgi:hypothetical protein
MRYWLILALVLAGCNYGSGQMKRPADSGNPITGDAISVTSLDSKAPSAVPPEIPQKPVTAAPTTPQPAKSEPEKPTAVPQVDTAKPIAPEVLACMKLGGEWSAVDDQGAMACIHRTRDSGKTCHRKSDCQSECLAKSNSCAPIMPLFGCNDILQDDGSMVTLCID